MLVVRGKIPPEPKVVLHRGAYIQARTVDPAGQPVPETPISVWLQTGQDEGVIFPLPGRREMENPAERNGRIRLGPLPAGYPVSLATDPRTKPLVVRGYDRTPRPRLPPGQVYQAPPLVINVGRGSLSGLVVNAAGRPVSGALVFAGGDSAYAKTDVQGRFQITSAPLEGPVHLVACEASQPLFAAVTVDAGAARDVSLTLLPPGQFAGKVTSWEGTAPRYALVRLEPIEQTIPRHPLLVSRLGGTRWLSARADAAGNWRIGNLIDGLTYSVRAEGGEYGPWGQPQPKLRARSGETVAVPTITLGQSR